MMRVRYLHTHGRHCCLMFDKGFANCQIHMRQAQSANYAFLYIGLRIPTPVGVSSLAFRRCKARLHCPKGAKNFESRCKYRINLRFSQRKTSKSVVGSPASLKLSSFVRRKLRMIRDFMIVKYYLIAVRQDFRSSAPRLESIDSGLYVATNIGGRLEAAGKDSQRTKVNVLNHRDGPIKPSRTFN